jgi:hypothetical protein
MKCYKCGKEAELKNGMCNDCYKELLNKKNKKHHKHKPKINYITSNLQSDEKVLNTLKLSRLVYAYITILFAISIILFPKTIVEFFFKDNKIYFLGLVFNILLFFFGVYLTLYFSAREICLTNKRILGKWGIFKIKTINLPLNNIQTIDTYNFKGLEIVSSKKTYSFDLISNNEKFKVSTIEQIKKLIDSASDENVLMSFSHSLNEKLDKYKFEENNPNMTYCSCCNKLISKNSIFCINCGQPLTENERSADLFIKILCFILPPIGLILFLINIGAYPKFAKQCLLSALLMVFLILIIYLSVLSIFL